MDSAAKAMIDGSTTDLQLLHAHVSTLAPGKTNHPSRALADREELIIVREGQLTLNLNDSSKVAGPGSITLIVAGDRQSFQNNSTAPVTYFVFGLYPILRLIRFGAGKTAAPSLKTGTN